MHGESNLAALIESPKGVRSELCGKRNMVRVNLKLNQNSQEKGIDMKDN